MGGTWLGVWTPYTADRVEPIAVAAMVAEGFVRDDLTPGLWRSTDDLPYNYSLDPPDLQIEPGELEAVERVAGEAMRCTVGFHIYVSDLAGRPVLGRLAQRVAERAEGWVFVEFRSPPPADLLCHLADAGRCIRVEDYVYLDASAMAAWYAHPSFNVVK